MKPQLSRRDFLKISTAAGGGLLIAVYLQGCKPGVEDVPTQTGMPGTSGTPQSSFQWTPNHTLLIDQNGVLTFTAFRSEMGQGIRTALAMLAAEELDIEWSSVRIIQADADQSFGDQATGGSVSIHDYQDGIRKAAAQARQLLVEAAAQTWGVKAGKCTTKTGYVIHPDGQQKLAYGSLVQAASKIEKPGQSTPKNPSDYSIVGKERGHWDAPDMVTGKAKFGLDIRLPGMLFAVIARCPVFSGTYTDYDDAGAKAVKGVKEVIALSDRIAIVAENSWAAIQGRNALKVTWDEGNNVSLDSDQLTKAAAARLKKSTSGNILEAYYEIPFEAHATMEPMNCTAHFHDGVCELWAPSQSPQDAQRAVALAIKLPVDKVIVHVPLLGGGFGRRLQTDYAVEAATLAKTVNAPVQVFWTREDDLQHDFYHPMTVQYAFASLEKPSLPTISVALGGYVPTGAWRSVENFTQAFSEQSFIDEMALALGRDPYDLRQELYGGNLRALNVIKLAAEKSSWGSPLPTGQGRGMAYFASFGVTPVAEVAEVSVDADGKIHVNRVVCVVDCGRAVNPGNVKAQMEGGIVFGLTAALKAKTTIKNGRALESNFHDYPIWRMDEMPVIEVHVVTSDKNPTGIGEMGVPPIAPAIANAVFAATGKRIRHIPIKPEDLKG